MLKFDKKKLRGLLFLVILVAIAPIAIELVFVSQILGAEVAVLFFLAFLKDQWQIIEARWERFKEEMFSTLAIISAHAISSPKVFYVHASVSIILFAVTGSIFYLCAVWYPVVLFGGAPGFG